MEPQHSARAEHDSQSCDQALLHLSQQRKKPRGSKGHLFLETQKVQRGGDGTVGLTLLLLGILFPEKLICCQRGCVSS